MADEKDTDLTSESGAAARSGETEDVEVGSDQVDDLNEAELDGASEATDEISDDEDGDEFTESDESDEERAASGAGEDGESDRELVGAGVASRSTTVSRPGDRSDRDRRRGRRPKGRPTPTRKSHAEEPEKGSPLTFIRGSIAELKQVVYPTGPQLMNYFVVVLVFVLFVIGIVTALDAGFGWIMLKVFG